MGADVDDNMGDVILGKVARDNVQRVAGANSRQVAGNHYLSPIQHWDYVAANDIPYLEAQVIKYLTRWRKKNGLEDVYKAQHYLEKLIEVEEAKAAARKETCKECEGSGQVGGKDASLSSPPCPKCNGSGKQAIEQENYHGIVPLT